ncbi:DUF3313 domain-containing protein [Aliirhizobium cellulosilyticum]|nr:DUF3313 domain-containing protein [Rhizobium cellulosilyticum]
MVQLLMPLALSATLASCNAVALQEGGSLKSYAGMTASNGTLTKSRIRVEGTSLLAAKTVRIVPTSIHPASAGNIAPRELALVANTIDRALCTGLSERFEIVAPSQLADLTVHATVTRIVPTNKSAATVSSVASIGATAVSVPMPRIPIGLGGLAVEAEATNMLGAQMAAIVWARGADMLTTQARASAVGDAYSLSSAFGKDFSKMLVTGKDPLKGMPQVPSVRKMTAALGGKSKFEACRTFGEAPGVTGMIAGRLGLPPAWSDKGASTKQFTQPH